MACHRELGQSNALQFVLLLSIANGIVELIASRNRWFHQVVIGQSIVLVSNGKVNSRLLKRQRLSEDDLVSQGANSIADIDRAVIAVNGEIVVTLHKDFELSEQIKALNLRIDKLLLSKP